MMKLNSGNRKISTKIFFGFMLILTLAMLMAGVLFYSLRSVSGILTRIIEQSAPSIRFPTAVERFALRAIIDEKNYLLLEKKEIHRQAMEDIRAIYDNLDKADEVARRYNAKTLLQKSKDVRQAAQAYQNYYNRAVALLEENQLLADKMRMLGRKVNDLSHTHTLKHKKLMEEAITEGKDEKKYLEAFHLCAEIEKEALEARRQEKNYMLYKKGEYFDLLKQHIANLKKLYGEITGNDDVFEHQALMEETLQATEEYLMSAGKWVTNDNKLSEVLAQMQELGVEVQRTAMDVQETGWSEMKNSKEIAVITTRKAFLSSISIGIIVLIAAFLSAFLIARGIARPIKELTQASEKIAKGDFSARVKIKTRDEVGFLANSFNKMVEDLQISQEKIQAQNEELNISNEELKASNEELTITNEELGTTSEELRLANGELLELREDLERKVQERTAELQKVKQELEKKVFALERFNKLSVGRELKMRELKEKIEELEKKLHG